MNASTPPVHPNARLLETFYAAFARRDGQAMAACYTPDASFADPVFTLDGSDIGAMWVMLCERGRDLRLEWRDVRADDSAGSAHWEARYTFSATGRQVHNVIDSAFTFRDGRIAAHRDRFNFWRWTRMALGPPGFAFGWARPMQAAIRAKARRGLDAWIAGRSSKMSTT